MDRVDGLLDAYSRQLSMPWRNDLSGAERVWMAVYPPDLERRVRARIADFELATREAGHSWALHDLTAAFSRWLRSQEYREAYFRDPAALAPALPKFLEFLEKGLELTLRSPEVGSTGVVAVLGVGALFPMVRVSDL